ncbi:MAG: hypothetical protein AAFR25_11305, partial [Cyanobacteria bacterium J06629_19]
HTWNKACANSLNYRYGEVKKTLTSDHNIHSNLATAFISVTALSYFAVAVRLIKKSGYLENASWALIIEMLTTPGSKDFFIVKR